MTLPASGLISLGMVATELGIALPLSLGDSRVRNLAGKPSGAISLGDLYGKKLASSTPLNVVLGNLDGDATSNPPQSYTATVRVTATVVGGTGPFSYTWTHVSGDGSVVNANSASTDAVFTVARFAPPSVLTQVIRCTVQDSTGAQASRQDEVTLYVN